ncbi:MAG: arsenate reductase ArsC [Acidobacteria bacterium]|nr:arsenate reductase ArsC [Acidobacteriota bacterium]MDA1234406.1 arsenate reductase ArsC [Acidobacteriota bacterium]
MKILVLCTGNSCRSQIAEAFLRSFDPRLEVESAGSKPAARVNPYAIRVMEEAGVDIFNGRPKNVAQFLNDKIDYVITVCGNAERDCPAFVGEVKHRLHIGFPDPADATGTEEEILAVFRQSRDEIHKRFQEFYETELLPQLGSQ